jgi:hypothetical protein
MIGDRQCYVEEKRTNGSRGKLMQLQSLPFFFPKKCQFYGMHVYFEKEYRFVPTCRVFANSHF